MTESDQESELRKCSQCGTVLPANVPPELCPKCLLRTGLAPIPTGQSKTVLAGALFAGGDFLQPGQEFGAYRIVRQLGGGGMGAVFEAEDTQSGRRLALKVLSQALDSPDARERFFREGRLAASINHPNSVYVFGTEEIGGTPVISMELVVGGTLQDRVQQRGPMQSSEAVDAVMQIISGLEAAQRVGILHRDVKPSNCFLDPEGTVKVGDFGLSISTALRLEPALTATGAFLGTPAFCSPEQLRGEELNVRSDIYSVGATLFYLLTGETPFKAQHLVGLIATVLEQKAPSPATLRKGVPRGLARIVARCLEKDPGERYPNYQALKGALTPYTSKAPAPATIGRRFLAGLLDSIVVGIVLQIFLFVDVGDAVDLMELFLTRSRHALLIMFGGLGAYLLYFALFEGVWGATPGKAICRLKVVSPGRNVPGFWTALARACIYLLPPLVPAWIICGFNVQEFVSGSKFSQLLVGVLQYAIVALLFVTARRRNGFAAMHDLATRTRVIVREALPIRPLVRHSEASPGALESLRTLGPYHVLESMGGDSGAEWLLGYDLRLLRKVWIRALPSGAPPVPVARRNLGRAGRLRWLTGRRAADENWDAYEAPGGESLLERAARERQPWTHVRFWLHDLAAELTAAERDGTMPNTLGLDRVWISGEGRAKLLDFVAPGIAAMQTSMAVENAFLPGSPPPGNRFTAFLREAAVVALEGASRMPHVAEAGAPRAPIPLHARKLLEELPRLGGLDSALVSLQAILTKPAFVSRHRRLAALAGCLLVPLAATVAGILGLSMVNRWNQEHPEIMQLSTLMSVRQAASWFRVNDRAPSDRHFAIYIAAHYRGIITNKDVWQGSLASMMITGGARRFAEQSVKGISSPAADETAEAERRIQPFVAQQQRPSLGRMLPVIAPMAALIYVGLPAVVAALLFRGGLVQRLAGIIFVRADGQSASRWRVFLRAVFSWAPLLFTLIVVLGLPGRDPGFGHALALGLCCVLAIVSIMLPDRGLSDRLAGTWPVPR